MNAVKKFLWALLAGSVAGGLVFAWLSPHVIVWYFSPPADLAISCKPAVEWAITTYRKVMFTGFLVGSVVGGLLFFAFGGRNRGSAQAVPGGARGGE